MPWSLVQFQHGLPLKELIIQVRYGVWASGSNQGLCYQGGDVALFKDRAEAEDMRVRITTFAETAPVSSQPMKYHIAEIFIED